MGGLSMSSDISLVDAVMYFSDESRAEDWFIKRRWRNGVKCPHCDSSKVSRHDDRPQPFRCRSCWKYFSVKTNTIMHSSKVSLSKWAITYHLVATHPKGINSIQLSKTIGVQQKTAWFMLHRIREIWNERPLKFLGGVEVDEMYVGGVEKNKHARNKLRNIYGKRPMWADGKTPVIGIKSRVSNKVYAEVINDTLRSTLFEFVHNRTFSDTDIFTDHSYGYRGVSDLHYSVNHKIGEYVRDMVTTNGIESFWAIFKRAFKGTYHKMSRKHLQRYVNEFSLVDIISTG